MARARSLFQFQKAFPHEQSCAEFLFERRWPRGLLKVGHKLEQQARNQGNSSRFESLSCRKNFRERHPAAEFRRPLNG